MEEVSILTYDIGNDVVINGSYTGESAPFIYTVKKYRRTALSSW